MSETLSDEELLPCPFCGGTELMVIARTCDPRTPYNPADFAYPRVWCKCGIEVAGANWGEKPTAIAAWNHRAPSPELLAARKKLEELEAALDERLPRIRLFIQDVLDTHFVRGATIGNLMSARDDVDALIARAALPSVPKGD